MKRALMIVVSLVLSVAGAWAPGASAGAAAAGRSEAGAPLAPAVSDRYRQFLFQAQNRINPNESTLTVTNVSSLGAAWTDPTGTANPFASPIVYRGLLIEGEYQCCPSPSRIQAFDATTGALVWTTDMPAPVVAASAAAAGVLFAGDYQGTLYALRARTGKVVWSGSAGDQFFDPDTIAVTGGIVYTTTRNGPLSAWRATGCGATTCEPFWTGDVAGAGSGPAVGDGMVFVPALDGHLDAFPATGCGTDVCEPTWAGTGLSAGAGFASVAVAGNLVYAGNQYSSHVLVYRTAGCGRPLCGPRWSYAVGANGIGPGAIGVTGGVAFLGGGDGLAAFPATCRAGMACRAVWIDAAHPASKLLVAGGVVYATSGTGLFAADASSGRTLWTTNVSGPYAEAPTVANGMLYMADTFGDRIMAFALRAGG